MARISRTGTTDSTGVASTTVNGSGGGRLKFISRNGGLWSNSYEVDDYSVIDDCTIASHNDDCWIHTDATKFVRGEEYTSLIYENRTLTAFLTGITDSCIVDFDLKRLDSNFVQGFLNVFDGSATSLIWFSLANIGLSATTEWLPLRLTITSSSATLTLRSDSTKTITKEYTATGTPNRVRFIINNIVTGFNIRNVKVLNVFSAPKHYTPIALSSSASIIQTGETATLSATLTNVLGEKLASKSVNFIEKVEHIYENTSEVSQVYNSGQNVTVLSPSISRTDLGTSWTLSFDMKTDTEARVFIGNSASAVPTNPQYSIFMGRDTSNVISYGFRTTTTTVSSSSVASTSYHSCKIVFNNGTITYYVDDTQVGTKTVSFYGNYDNYVVGLVAWGTGTLYAKNIVLDNGSGGDILIGTGTTNSQGIATCNVTGTGKGERQFIASNSSILSETYTIMDTP